MKKIRRGLFKVGWGGGFFKEGRDFYFEIVMGLERIVFIKIFLKIELELELGLVRDKV